MSAVTVATGSLECKDEGKATMTGSSRLTVSGVGVVLFSGVAGPTPYAGCTFQVSGNAKPCALTTPVSGGKATKLTVDSSPVLLDDLVAKTDNASDVSITAGQSKLTAV